MKNIIMRKCPRCQERKEFEVRKGKNNLKVICQTCGLKVFVKTDEEVRENLESYFNYRFEKRKGVRK